MKKTFNFLISIIIISVFMLISAPVYTFAANSSNENYNALIDTGFESGEFEGWSSFGNKSQISISSEKAYGGFSSLKSHTREEAWSGPALNITDIIKGGHEYLFRLYAISDTAPEIEISITLKYVDDAGAETYVNMTTATVTNKKWEFIEATATIPENATDIIFYTETIEGTDEFYIDDVSIYGYKPFQEIVYEENEESLEFNFESSLDGWIPRGEISLELSEDFKYSGSKSLYVSNKKEIWNAPMVRITKVSPGINYTYSAYVMYIDKHCDDDHFFSIRLQYNLDGEETYVTIKSKRLENGTWSKISGDYILPHNATDIYFYISTDEDQGLLTENIAFYVDNVKIADSSAALKSRRQNTIIMCAIAFAVIAVNIFLLKWFIKKQHETKKAILASAIDAMTGANNRNTYEKYIEELEKNPEKCKHLYVMACDVNFLKYINDNYGHDCGDKAIIRCAAVLLRVYGKKGTVYRIGGDEFMCFSSSNLLDAVKVEFARESLDYKGYPFSAAVGIANYDPQIDLDGPDIKALITRSDKAMYNHKVEIKKNSDFIN